MPGLRYETNREDAARIEAEIIQKLKTYAAGKNISDPIVRDILPNEDLLGAGEVGSGNFWQQALSACQYHTVYSGKNDKDRAFAIFKVGNSKGKPLTAAIRFHDEVGRTKILDIWQVQHAWLNEDNEAYCETEDAIFYGVERGYNIDFLAKADSGMDNVILGGKVVEPRGKIVNPKPPF